MEKIQIFIKTIMHCGIELHCFFDFLFYDLISPISYGQVVNWIHSGKQRFINYPFSGSDSQNMH